MILSDEDLEEIPGRIRYAITNVGTSTVMTKQALEIMQDNIRDLIEDRKESQAQIRELVAETENMRTVFFVQNKQLKESLVAALDGTIAEGKEHNRTKLERDAVKDAFNEALSLVMEDYPKEWVERLLRIAAGTEKRWKDG